MTYLNTSFCGYTLLEKSPSGGVYAVHNFSPRVWAVLEISATDFVLMSNAFWRKTPAPPLTSAKLITQLHLTRKAALEEFESERGLLTREHVLAILEKENKEPN